MPANTNYEKLLQPHHIGSVLARNRIVKTGASMCYWHSDHVHMTEKAKAYYGALAKGGVGLLIVESPIVDYPLGTRWHERYRIDDDRFLPGLTELAEAIHAHGCPTFLQLWHDGPWQSPLFAPPAMFDGPPVGASPVNLETLGDFHRDVPRALTIPEIEDIVDKFANAAVRAQKAGFDGVDINAASSHLLHNFLSPFWNRRQDEYGGSVENRARFTVEIVRETKKRTGPDFAVSVLMNAIELGRAFDIPDADCLTHDQALQLGRLFQDAGADAIQVRNHWLGYHVGGFFPDYLFYPEPPIPKDRFPKEYNASQNGVAANLHLAAAMKRNLSIPVIIVGKLDPDIGEKILRDGGADFIAMTRRLQADTELPNKIAAGRPGDVAPCTACGTCLDQSVSMERRCRINAAMGTEQYTLEKAERPKRVVVVGGGPAGMEAARVAALRGHRVTLYEKTRQLGGLMPLAALVKGPEPEDLLEMVEYLERQIRQLGVRIELGKEADGAVIAATKPDAVILATGGTLTVPEVSGVDGPNVITTPALHRRVKPLLRFVGPGTLDVLTKHYLPMGERVVVIGGGFHGCEVAEFLVKRGRKVTIVESSDVIGTGVLDFRLGLLLDWFAKRGVDLVTGAADMVIDRDGVSYTASDGSRHTVAADTVVPTSPLTPNLALVESLEGRVPELYAIGDCREPGMIVDAIADAWRAAGHL